MPAISRRIAIPFYRVFVIMLKVCGR